MSGFTQINHGIIVSLADLLKEKVKYAEKSVRVVGALHSLDILEKQVVLTDKKQKFLTVDISLIFDFKWVEGGWYQVIGEVSNTEDITLKARVVRCVTGLDVDLYNNVTSLLSDFLQ